MAIVFIRTVIVFAVLIFSMRLMGKRQLGELELSEIVVAVLISNLSSQPLQDIEIPLLNGILPVFILLCCETLITGGIIRSIRFRSLICGRPSIIIRNGVIDQREMHKVRLCMDEVTEALRRCGVVDISTVQYGILETDGSLSVLQFPSEMAPSAGDLQIQAPERSLPKCVISQGRVLDHNLRDSGKDRAWLQKQLQQRGVTSPAEVYYMSVDEQNRVYFAAKEVRA